jgi:hypothetical protein
MQLAALAFQKEGHCSYEPGKIFNSSPSVRPLVGHAAADAQSR